MVQVPELINTRLPSDTIQTVDVDELKDTVNPEVAVATKLPGLPMVCVPGFVKLIVCDVFGVTEVDAEDGEPVPAELAAVTVKV